MKEEIETLLLEDGNIHEYIEDKVNQAHHYWLMVFFVLILLFIGYATQKHTEIEYLKSNKEVVK